MACLWNNNELRPRYERGVLLSCCRRSERVLLADDHQCREGDAWKQLGCILSLRHTA